MHTASGTLRLSARVPRLPVFLGCGLAFHATNHVHTHRVRILWDTRTRKRSLTHTRPRCRPLQNRLEFLYDWAVEGPPLAMPLGMLARPRSYLTAVQQVFAEQLGKPVGNICFDTLLLQNDEDQVRKEPALGGGGTGAAGGTGRAGRGQGPPASEMAELNCLRRQRSAIESSPQAASSVAALSRRPLLLHAAHVRVANAHHHGRLCVRCARRCSLPTGCPRWAPGRWPARR